MNTARALPIAALPPGIDAPPTPEELAAAARASALAAAAERGLLAAGARALALSRELGAKLERTLGHYNAPGLAAALLEIVNKHNPDVLGPIVFCDKCGQVGEALELWQGRVRWYWSGRNPLGQVVHHARIVQLRELGDMPPRSCPDHEPPHREGARVLELERRRA